MVDQNSSPDAQKAFKLNLSCVGGITEEVAAAADDQPPADDADDDAGAADTNTNTNTNNSGNYDADDYDADDVRGTIRIGGGCYTNRAGWGCVEGARCGYWEYDGDADYTTSSSSNSGSGTSYQGGTCVDEDTCGDDGTGSYDDYTLECSAVLLKISAAAMLGYNMM